MADKKISALTAATTPLAGTEVLPIVQSGDNVKVAIDDLTVKNIRSNATTGLLQIAGPGAGTTRIMTTPNANFTAARTDAAQSFTGNQTLSDSDLVIGTSGKGINFTANTGAAGMTSQLLNWYEEGTWTPTGNGITFTTASGQYTKIGRVVYVTFYVVFPTTSNASQANIRSLPFTVGSGATSRGGSFLASTDYGSAFTMMPNDGTTNILFYDLSGNDIANSAFSTKSIVGSAIYSV